MSANTPPPRPTSCRIRMASGGTPSSRWRNRRSSQQMPWRNCRRSLEASSTVARSYFDGRAPREARPHSPPRGARASRGPPRLPDSQADAIMGPKSMRLRLRLVLLLMLPLLVVSGRLRGGPCAAGDARAGADERERAAATARTIQIAVENSLAAARSATRRARRAARRPDARAAGDRADSPPRPDGRVLAASNARTVALTSEQRRHRAGDRDGDGGDGREPVATDGAWWVYMLPVQYSAPTDQLRAVAARMALEIAFVAPNSRTMARQAIRDVLLRVGALTVVLALLIAVVLQRQVLRPWRTWPARSAPSAKAGAARRCP